MTIGDRIKKIRESNGVGQTELANATKISKQNIYKYENNIITNIPSDKIESIADYLNVSPAKLMGWEDDDRTPTQLTESEMKAGWRYIRKDEHGNCYWDFDNPNIHLSEKEQKMLKAYRTKPDVQPYVDKLLDIN